MFCDFCGARITEGSRFCPACGARLAVLKSPGQDAPRTSKPGAGRIASPEPSASSSAPCARTRTMTEAAGLAVPRNPSGTWRDRFDSGRSFTVDAKKLLRLCEKEDRYVDSCEDRNGVLYYVVSPGGAVGQVYLDDGDEYLIPEWMYLTPASDREKLPQTPDELSYID